MLLPCSRDSNLVGAATARRGPRYYLAGATEHDVNTSLRIVRAFHDAGAIAIPGRPPMGNNEFGTAHMRGHPLGTAGPAPGGPRCRIAHPSDNSKQVVYEPLG
jgi:hypothetical protein